MEDMVNLFGGIYSGKKIVITGNTGFKGSWMAYWLTRMGASVHGFSKNIPTDPSHFELMEKQYSDIIYGDVANIDEVEKVMSSTKVDLVFHLAAQPLVTYSYKNPLETFKTNVMGTLTVLEACKRYPGIKGIVVVTSDKCYENPGDNQPLSEQSRMGGFDPYSASKGCAELVSNSYRNSYFPVKEYGKNHNFILATARAGNVIGGGDWSQDRLIPDVVKNAARGIGTTIRSPKSTRPWQHVLESISGYLVLGQKILNSETIAADGWNFGPENNETLTVVDVLNKASKFWPAIQYESDHDNKGPHEATFLRLECTKSNQLLHWSPVWNTDLAIEKTILWYKNFYERGVVNTEEDLINYVRQAKNLKHFWAL